MALEQQQELRQLNLNPQFRTQQHLWAPQTPPSPKKVKLLCSFGGKIIPRPSDGTLRYVGGHTRIVSVNKDVAFADLMAKMAEVSGGGGPVIFKYQLPNEDLDALISVSSAEDLENMMDEYEKIVESAGDGSAKIRVFLFSPAESSDLGAGDLSDTGQRYFDAVNGIGIGSGGSSSIGSLKRKDSGLSAGSSNSAVESVDYVSDGNVASPQTLVSDPSVDYLGQGYLDPSYLNPHAVNLVPLPTNVGIAAAPQSVPVSNRVSQPLSQLPPLAPLVNAEAYGLNSSPGVNQEVGVRLDDCHMCQKMLPHAHSDSLAQNVGNGSPGTGNIASPVFYSQQLEDAMRGRAAPPPNFGDSVVEPKVDSQSGVYGFPQYEGERPYTQKMENTDHATVFLPSGSPNLSPDMQSSYGLFLGNFPQSQQGLPPVQRQQYYQQQWQQNVISPQYPVLPEAIGRHAGSNVGPVRNAGGSPEFSNEYARSVNEAMEGLHLNPTVTSGFSRQGTAVARPESSPLVVDSAYGYMPNIGGNVIMNPAGPFANSGVVHERNYGRANEQLPPNTSDFICMQNFLPPEPNQVFSMSGNPGPFPHLRGILGEPPIPSEGLLAMPAYASGTDPAYSDRGVNQTPIGDSRDESSSSKFIHLAVPQTGNAPVVEAFQEPASAESLFCNQDPRKIVGGAHPLPPRPKRVASRESIALVLNGMRFSDLISILFVVYSLNSWW